MKHILITKNHREIQTNSSSDEVESLVATMPTPIVSCTFQGPISFLVDRMRHLSLRIPITILIAI